MQELFFQQQCILRPTLKGFKFAPNSSSDVQSGSNGLKIRKGDAWKNQTLITLERWV